MSELQQLEKLQKAIREIKKLKIITPTIEPPPNRLSQNQIFAGGEMNMLIRMNEIIEKYLGKDF
jgi:hypothetical protein